jgi:shikimate kinase
LVVNIVDQNIALIGFMAAGKTRVGLALSSITGWPFRDIDALIEGIAQLPVHQIFEERGEAYFRQLETAVLRDLCQGRGQIIGCGGGTVLLEENRLRLRDRCYTVWLRVSMRTVLERLDEPQNPRRPLLEGRDFEAVIERLLQAREPLYREADWAVEAEGRGVDEIAREIAVQLGLPIFEQ